MTELVQFMVHDNGSVFVEVDGHDPGYPPEYDTGIGPVGRRGRGQERHAISFEQHLAGVREAATAALDEFRKGVSPDEIKLTFGVKMTAEAGAVIAKTSFEGNLGVELVWRKAASHQGGEA